MADWALILGGAGAAGVIGASMEINRLTKRVGNLETMLGAVFRYAQEIDPRHDEERRLLDALYHGDGMFDGLNHYEFVKEKRARGERTLHDPIIPPEGR